MSKQTNLINMLQNTTTEFNNCNHTKYPKLTNPTILHDAFRRRQKTQTDKNQKSLALINVSGSYQRFSTSTFVN